ncbi:hypothetical protein QTO34_014301 [Cnephaeus nilssonii]|uniref:Uncharacterized protein n=1 Tax=Cnephaeus nilssonii TaxID=3371016 RepID=A0AA40I625_CNENI|nr:hypothetical protein QTO34_014301 [Eptesicus nilssonii]
MHPLNWTEVEQQAFEKLKKALVSAPALALPDVTKPFHLHVSEVRGIAKGVLIQTLGPWKRPVAYLSKRLDPVVAGWPACLRAVATTALLELALTTPHDVEALLRGAPERWMSNTRITQCQALLLDQPCVRFHKTLAINPASLLPDDNPEEPIQDCTEVTDAVRTARPDLTDVPLSSPDKVLFTLCSGWHPICRAAVVALDRTIWAQSLDRGTTAQKVELLALIQALRWGHSAIHRERGLPTTAGKDIKNKEEILALLEVIWLPRAVAIVHCKGHQKGETIAARGNRAADQTAKEAAQKPMGPLRRPPLTPNKRRNWQNRSKPSKDQMVGEHWEVDFTEIKPPASGYKYLLALIDTFSGWVEAYPIRTETAFYSCQEIIPSFGLPVVIGSDNSPACLCSQSISKHEQDSKSTLTKFVLETGENWTNLLPFAILWARCTPYQKGFPLRLLYTQRATHKLVRDALPVPTADPVHPFQPGDSGCYTVILSIPTAVEVDGTQIWLHHSQLLHQETAWILATSGLTREIPSLGSTQARRRLNTCRRGTGLQ